MINVSNYMIQPKFGMRERYMTMEWVLARVVSWLNRVTQTYFNLLIRKFNL